MGSPEWTFCWIDSCGSQFYKKLFPCQKINHIPGIEQLTRKKNLARNMMVPSDERVTNVGFSCLLSVRMHAHNAFRVHVLALCALFVVVRVRLISPSGARAR